MRKQVEVYLKEAYGKERARPDLEDGHFSFGGLQCVICVGVVCDGGWYSIVWCCDEF